MEKISTSINPTLVQRFDQGTTYNDTICYSSN
jgi:hypothetical protein